MYDTQMMISNSSDKSRILFLNSSWLFGGKTAAGIFAALETLILARKLGVENYGILVLVVAYVDILNNFFDFRVWETATKYIGSFWDGQERDKALSIIKLSYIINLVSGSAAVLITIITAKLASKYIIHSSDAFYYICIYSFSMLINTANSTSDAILRIFDRFKKLAFISTVYSFLKFLMVLIILYLGMGIKEVLISYVLASIVSFVIRYAFVSQILKENQLQQWWRARLSSISDKWKEIMWFLCNTSFAGTLKMANDEYIGVLLLGYWSGKDAVAYYKVAKSFVKLLMRLSDPLYEAIYPELVRFININALHELKDLLLKSTKNLMIISIPITILVLIFANQIIDLIYGNTYSASVTALRVITLGGLLSISVFWISPVLLAVGRPGLRNILDIVTIISYIIMLVLLVPGFSYVGAAIAFLASMVVRILVSIYALKTSLNKRSHFLIQTTTPK